MITTIITISLLLAALAGIVTSTTMLWRKVIKPTWKFLRRLGRVAEVIHELPEWCTSVDDVLLELRPNHGGSMKDKITTIQFLIEQHTQDSRLHSSTGTTVIVDNSSTIE